MNSQRFITKCDDTSTDACVGMIVASTAVVVLEIAKAIVSKQMNSSEPKEEKKSWFGWFKK